MVPVVLISPYRGDESGETNRNIEYAKRAARDCLYAHGEAPFASHLLYTQMLDDTAPAERALGLQAGDEWAKLAVRLVVYTDYGFTSGMTESINKSDKPCIHRSIGLNDGGPKKDAE